MLLAPIVITAVQFLQNSFVFSEKLQGLDVFAVVMESDWNNATTAIDWKLNVTRCLEEMFDFENSKSRFGLGCSVQLQQNAAQEGYFYKLTSNAKIPTMHGNLCPGTSRKENLRDVLESAAAKVNDVRKDTSLITVVLADENLKQTTLKGKAVFFANDSNLLFIIVKTEYDIDNIKGRLAGRSTLKSRVLEFHNDGCTDYFMDNFQRALCEPRYEEILKETNCAKEFSSRKTFCAKRVTFKPQIRNSATVCRGLHKVVIRYCPCPTNGTTAASGFFKGRGVLIGCAIGLGFLIIAGVVVGVWLRRRLNRPIEASMRSKISRSVKSMAKIDTAEKSVFLKSAKSMSVTGSKVTPKTSEIPKSETATKSQSKPQAKE